MCIFYGFYKSFIINSLGKGMFVSYSQNDVFSLQKRAILGFVKHIFTIAKAYIYARKLML